MVRLLVIGFALSLAGCSSDTAAPPTPGAGKSVPNTPPAKGKTPPME